MGLQFTRIVSAVTPASRFQHRLPLAPLEAGDEEDQLDPRPEPRLANPLEPGDVQEEELAGEGEILLQQPIAHEGAPAEGEHPLVLVEADRA